MPEAFQSPEPEVAWIGAEDLPVEFANTFSGVIGANAVFVNIGSMVPPVVETDEQLANLRFVPVKPIARIALAPKGLDDLIEILESTRDNRGADVHPCRSGVFLDESVAAGRSRDPGQSEGRQRTDV